MSRCPKTALIEVHYQTMGQWRPNFRAIAALLAAALSLFATQAFAQSSPTNRLGLGFQGGQASSRPEAPPVGRYVAEGVAEFTFDNSSAPPTLRFAGNSEIIVLSPQSAPRGDTVYKNDLGEPVLRASRLGGLTVFTSTRPQGSPAQVVGPAQQLQLAALRDATELFRKIVLVQNRISRAAGRVITVDVPDVGPESLTLVGDVADLTANAVERNSRSPEDRAKMRSLEQVLIVEGARPSVDVIDDTVRITVAPSLGVGGRPSSERIARALTR